VPLGKLLILSGIILVAIGLVLTLGQAFPGAFGWIGRLPGDIRIEGSRGTFYFPLVTCLVISVVLSLIFWLLGR
jgi:hypothetical protein